MEKLGINPILKKVKLTLYKLNKIFFLVILEEKNLYLRGKNISGPSGNPLGSMATTEHFPGNQIPDYRNSVQFWKYCGEAFLLLKGKKNSAELLNLVGI